MSVICCCAMLPEIHWGILYIHKVLIFPFNRGLCAFWNLFLYILSLDSNFFSLCPCSYLCWCQSAPRELVCDQFYDDILLFSAMTVWTLGTQSHSQQSACLRFCLWDCVSVTPPPGVQSSRLTNSQALYMEQERLLWALVLSSNQESCPLSYMGVFYCRYSPETPPLLSRSTWRLDLRSTFLVHICSTDMLHFFWAQLILILFIY